MARSEVVLIDTGQGLAGEAMTGEGGVGDTGALSFINSWIRESFLHHVTIVKAYFAHDEVNSEHRSKVGDVRRVLRGSYQLVDGTEV